MNNYKKNFKTSKKLKIPKNKQNNKKQQHKKLSAKRKNKIPITQNICYISKYMVYKKYKKTMQNK